MGTGRPNGRPPTELTKLRHACEVMQPYAEGIAHVLITKALTGDRESAIYVLDRLYGKPKLQVESKTLNVSISGEQLLELQRQWAGELDGDTQSLISQYASTPSTPMPNASVALCDSDNQGDADSN